MKKKTPGNKIGREDSAGQNPFWPGEGAQPPDTTVKTDKETTKVPIVDSKPHPNGSKT